MSSRKSAPFRGTLKPPALQVDSLLKKRFWITMISWVLSIASLFFGSFFVEGWKGVLWGLLFTIVINGIAYFFAIRIKKERMTFKDGKITCRNSKEKTE